MGVKTPKTSPPSGSKGGADYMQRPSSSVAAWRTQRRSVSGVQPILDAIDVIAAHCERHSPPVSLAMRVVRSMTSAEYLGRFFMAPCSQTLEPLQNPGDSVTLGGIPARDRGADGVRVDLNQYLEHKLTFP